MAQLEKDDKSHTSIPKEMNAYLFYGPEDIRYEKVKTPKISEDEILVKVKAVLTCGTDLKTYLRGHPVLIKETPALFGHQFSGEVVQVGKNVKNFKIGQNVIPVNSSPCFKCIYCKVEKYSLCENILFLNGAYAEYIKVPKEIIENNTYEVPANTPLEVAAFLESLAVVMHGFDKSEITKDKVVCIIGSGSIGLLFAALVKKVGAKVICIGRSKSKLDLAKEIGADYTFSMSDLSFEELASKINGITGGIGPDVVIEAVGQKETWEYATKIVGKGGLVNFFGGCKKGVKVELDTYRLHYEELKILGVFHHTPHYVKKALKVLSEKNFQHNILEKIITNKMPLSRLEEAFKLQKDGKVIQVAIEPEDKIMDRKTIN